ncbi:MAG: hypothetical protein Q8P55_00705 [bacterium]|nr:hypothetical protein [bacterium]
MAVSIGEVLTFKRRQSELTGSSLHKGGLPVRLDEQVPISPDRYGRLGQEIFEMHKNQIGARHVAKARGLMPRNGEKILSDGSIITNTQILYDREQGIVEGTAKNGTFFQIAVPLSAIGL